MNGRGRGRGGQGGRSSGSGRNASGAAWIRILMNRLKVVEMEIGVPSMDEVLVVERIHFVADCSGRWHCLLGLYMNLSIRIA
jgi:hypothetical protein